MALQSEAVDYFQGLFACTENVNPSGLIVDVEKKIVLRFLLER